MVHKALRVAKTLKANSTRIGTSNVSPPNRFDAMFLETMQSKLLKGWSSVGTLVTIKTGQDTRFAILNIVTGIVFLDAKTSFGIEVCKSSLRKLLDDANKTLGVIFRKVEPLVKVILHTI